MKSSRKGIDNICRVDFCCLVDLCSNPRNHGFRCATTVLDTGQARVKSLVYSDASPCQYRFFSTLYPKVRRNVVLMLAIDPVFPHETQRSKCKTALVQLSAASIVYGMRGRRMQSGPIRPVLQFASFMDTYQLATRVQSVLVQRRDYASCDSVSAVWTVVLENAA